MLKRYPEIKNDLLQAWDAADDLILAHLQTLDLDGKRIVILNDQFGALAIGLKEFSPTSYTDSFVSAEGARLNSDGAVVCIHNLDELEGIYDYAILRVPKNLSFFEDELAHLSAHLGPHSKVICGFMVKHVANTSFDLLNQYIGKTSTSLAQKKARLIFADFEKSAVTSKYPLKVAMPGFKFPFTNHSNLFSREKLDVGTRFFLEHIPKGDFKTILDLGSANGVVGIRAKQLNPQASIIFSDESQMAIQSSKTNYEAYSKDEARYVWTNCYEKQEPESLDLVLCNPPFHQHNTIGDFIAWQMFNDAYKALKTGGTLRIIGNSHLGYQTSLKKIFKNSSVIATNSKFMIIEAKKL
jgi:23S rRNA (guanine1835-N2)-methyltransferase